VGRWDAALVGRAISEARRKADFVFVSFHWGVEFSHRPTATQMKIARFCIDQGADAVIGCHPHVLQGIEIYKGRPIFYSLGNFIFDQAYEPACRSVFAVLRVSAKRLEEILLRPVYIRDCIPELAAGEKKEAIIADLQEYSKVFGTEFTLTGDGLRVLHSGR
jgi:poly-gamma-glutamate synthesis protein (capsule biosynthesis protein)